jgi:hypothetical protein
VVLIDPHLSEAENVLKKALLIIFVSNWIVDTVEVIVGINRIDRASANRVFFISFLFNEAEWART